MQRKLRFFSILLGIAALICQLLHWCSVQSLGRFIFVTYRGKENPRFPALSQERQEAIISESLNKKHRYAIGRDIALIAAVQLAFLSLLRKKK